MSVQSDKHCRRGHLTLTVEPAASDGPAVLTLGFCSTSLPGEPKSLPQHPQQEDYSHCRVCSAALALCRRMEPPCSSSLVVFALFFCIVYFLQTVSSLNCTLYGFWIARPTLFRDRQRRGRGVEVRRLPEEISRLLLHSVTGVSTSTVVM